MTTENIVLSQLDDQSLLDTTVRLALEERRATAALLRALMEIDSRRLYLGQGCASMFTYCTQVLHLSEGAAYNRIEAARAARRYPLILELLDESAVTLTTIRLLGPHLTADNHCAVLASARHKSRREVEELVAALNPKPDAPVIMRRLPQSRTASVAVLPTLSVDGPVSVPEGGPATPVRMPPLRVATPLAPERYRIQLTVSKNTHDKFLRAQALLRHSLPSGDPAEIFDRALTLLVAELERRKAAQVTHPRATAHCGGTSRHIPATVRREVWNRDSGRCAFVGQHGRCRETSMLEFHHVQPFAAGGPATVPNIELRCRAHNAFESSLFFAGGGADLAREASDHWAAAPRCLSPRSVATTQNFEESRARCLITAAISSTAFTRRVPR